MNYINICVSIHITTEIWAFGRAWMAQWWEHSPPTNVARVRLPDSVLHLGWVCCWFSSLLREVISRFSEFPPLLKNQHFPKFQFNLECEGHRFATLNRLLSVTLYGAEFLSAYNVNDSLYGVLKEQSMWLALIFSLSFARALRPCGSCTLQTSVLCWE